MKSIQEKVLFITCMPSWKVSAAIWISYSVENPLVAASEERNSTMGATLGALKTRKAAVFRSVNFRWGTSVEITSWKFSVSFKAYLRNLVRRLFMVALQTDYCKPTTPLKRGLLEISRKVTFRNIPCPCYIFFNRVAKDRSFSYFAKMWFHHRRSLSNFEVSQNKERKHLGWNQFLA